MIKMPVDQVIKKINEATGISESEIKEQINSKLKTLDGLVSEEGAAYIIASELGVKLFDEVSGTGGSIKINKILPGMRSVEIVGKVTRLFDPITFERDGKKGRVGSFILADETGSIRVAIWDERIDMFNKELKEGSVIRIKDAYSKENNRGGLEVHLARRSQLILDVNENIEVAVSNRFSMNFSKIKDVTPNENYRLVGTIVQLFNPFFYSVCPECGKKAIESDTGMVCGEHGNIEPKPAMVFSFILDDGTDLIRCVAFRDNAEKLTGLTSEDAKEIAENEDAVILKEKIDANILARIVEIEGRVNENIDFERVELLVNRVNLNPDAKRIAQDMLRSG